MPTLHKRSICFANDERCTVQGVILLNSRNRDSYKRLAGQIKRACLAYPTREGHYEIACAYQDNHCHEEQIEGIRAWCAEPCRTRLELAAIVVEEEGIHDQT